MKKKVFREFQRAIWEAKFKEAEEARKQLEKKKEETKQRGRKKSDKSDK